MKLGKIETTTFGALMLTACSRALRIARLSEILRIRKQTTFYQPKNNSLHSKLLLSKLVGNLHCVYKVWALPALLWKKEQLTKIKENQPCRQLGACFNDQSLALETVLEKNRAS